MVYSRNYARMFVTLKQECSDYCFDLREAMGRCVIEVRFGKGRFNAFVQGLKCGVYKICFVSCTGGRNVGVIMGKIFVDGNGKGEFKTEFDPDNVCGSGIKIEDFHVAAVVLPDGERLTSLLMGYVNGTVSWKEGFTYYNREEDRREQEEDREEQEEDREEQEEDREEQEEDREEQEEDRREQEEDREEQEEDRREQEEDREEQEEDRREQEEDREEQEEDRREQEEDRREQEEDRERKERESYAEESMFSVETEAQKAERFAFEAIDDIEEAGKAFNEVVNRFKSGLEEISAAEENNLGKIKFESFEEEKDKNFFGLDYVFGNNAKMSPFQKQNKDIEWVRIGLSELVLLPGRMWIYLNNPFVTCAEKKYRHLILGKYNERQNDEYVLGVPGTYFSDYRLEAGLQGFKQFKCCENKTPSEGDYGYWIMHVEENAD